jgi:hypothetical protein
MVAAGISTGLQVAGDYMGQRAQAKAAQATMNAQAKAAITEMNWNIMDLEQQRTDAFDQAVVEISNTRLNSMQLNSGVKAAVNETMSGRTANLIVRAAEGDTARAVSSIQDNYQRKSNEVDLNRERQVKSTHEFLENLNASAPKMPSRFTNLLSSAATGLNNYTQAQNILNQQKITGSSGKTAKTATKTWVGNAPRSIHEKLGIGNGIYRR